MKNRGILFWIVIGLSFQFCFSQQEIVETQKLKTLCKVWGFLKYYHPEVSKGKFDWDQKLIEVLPKIERATTKKTLSQVYLDWITSLGKVKECKSCLKESNQQYFDKNFDLSWIQDTLQFSKEVSYKLKYIEQNRFRGKSKYVSVSKHVGNVIITNEPKYENFEYPSAEYRLLSLFRYWNIIEYFFPYKYMTDQNWNDVLLEMIPKYRYANDTTSYHLAMLETVTKIDDSHAYGFYTKYTSDYLGGGRKSPPVMLSIYNDSVYVSRFYNDSIAKKNSFQLGDVITEINRKPTSEVLKQVYGYTPGSNKRQKQVWTLRTLLRRNRDSILVTYGKRGNFKERFVKLYSFQDFNYTPVRPFKKLKILKENIGYLNVENVTGNEVQEIMETLVRCKAIIIDLRYSTKNIFRRISRHLNPTPKEFVKIIKPDLSYPGRFIWKEKKTSGIINKNYFKGEVVILVNQNTMSLAEYTAMSLQTAPNVVTIGNQTAGADGNVSSIEFVGGFKTSMSGTGIFYPNGTETQRNGVEIDIVVKPSIPGLIKGKDEIFEYAVKYLTRK